MAEMLPKSFFRDYLFGQQPEGFKGTKGFKGAQLRRLDAMNQIFQAIEGTKGLGASGEQQIQDFTKTATAQARQNAATRGLTNSTILGSAETGVNAHANKARLALQESLQDRINQLRTSLAGVYAGNFGGSAPPPSSGGIGGLIGLGLGSFLGGFGNTLGGSLLQNKG